MCTPTLHPYQTQDLADKDAQLKQTNAQLKEAKEVADKLKANDLKLSMRIAEKEKELSLTKLMNRNKDELITAKDAELAAAKAALLASTDGKGQGDRAAAAEGVSEQGTEY